MNKRPKCAIEGCENEAFVLYADKWICGKCLAKFNNIINENKFKSMQEVLNGSTYLS